MQKPVHTIQEKHKNRKLIVFDLDGTLAESKMDIDQEMALLLRKLLEKKKVAVIGGGKYELFQSQLLARLNAPEALLKNLFLFPTTSTAFYRYRNNSWWRVYYHEISVKDRRRIIKTIRETLEELNYKQPPKIYGDLIEDRGTQVTFSALGQKAPVHLKEKWKKENTALKLKIAKSLQKKLPDLEVRAAGYTSIDVTQKGIDKAYGLRQIKKHLGIPFSEMLFVGDALFPGGNDYATLKTGVDCIAVAGPEDAKKLIGLLLISNDNDLKVS